VTFAGTVPNGGKTVTIQTSTGYAVTHVHLGSIAVLRGTTVEEGATVGTVGPSGVPDVSEPYVYLGIRVASDDQGYVDPLLFLPSRPAPPASTPSASDPPPEVPSGEASAPPAAAEPAPPAPPAASSEPPADAGSAPDEGSDSDAGEAPSSPAGETGEASPEAGDEAAPQSEPASAPGPEARPGAAEQPSATAPAALPAAEPGADGTDAETAAAPEGELERAGDWADAAPPASAPAATFREGSRAGAPAQPSAEASSGEAAAALHWYPAAADDHAVPVSVTSIRGVHPLLTATGPQRRALDHAQRPPSIGWGRLDPADTTAAGGARVAVRHGRNGDAALRTTSLRAAGSLGTALLAATLAALVLRRRRRQGPGVTPASAEAPRMMVLVGGSGHAADPRGADRQRRRLDLRRESVDRHERFAA
jgi:hypothetical protein